MGKMLIINGSPRAPKSNSAEYIRMFRQFCADAREYQVTSGKHEEICAAVDQYDDLLFVFPLYVDGVPVTMMKFLKELACTPGLEKKPTVHVLINCGFLEPGQNLTAVDMIRLFCRQNGFPSGSVLCIGSGEAILTTPFRGLVRRKIKAFARSISQKKARNFKVSMPLPKKVFIRASIRYWLGMGAKNGLGREEMEDMRIEGE